MRCGVFCLGRCPGHSQGERTGTGTSAGTGEAQGAPSCRTGSRTGISPSRCCGQSGEYRRVTHVAPQEKTPSRHERRTRSRSGDAEAACWWCCSCFSLVCCSCRNRVFLAKPFGCGNTFDGCRTVCFVLFRIQNRRFKGCFRSVPAVCVFVCAVCLCVLSHLNTVTKSACPINLNDKRIHKQNFTFSEPDEPKKFGRWRETHTNTLVVDFVGQTDEFHECGKLHTIQNGFDPGR